ncbi:tetratricopeptide repeat protein [Myxococcota bacterium]|nr:tetratricopeptide repeat protein [Myxococcota bacterium]MBU1898919.1 tetratricopeptide repeat protein [Myxococcota bacterium]
MKEKLARRHFERGKQFELMDQLDEAAEAYQRACELAPSFPEPFFALGRIEANQGDYEEALSLLDEAVLRAPEREFFEWRAFVKGRLRRHEEAIEDYRRVDESDPQVVLNIARMLLGLRRYDEVEACLSGLTEPQAEVLLDALPRYREFFEHESLTTARAYHYLFAQTVLLGTLGGAEGGDEDYLLFTPAHISFSLQRLNLVIKALGWRFEAVAGEGPHHGPLAEIMADWLGLPLNPDPAAGLRTLLISAVLEDLKASKAASRALREAKTPHVHFALSFSNLNGEPTKEGPDVVGYLGKSAVWWYRVASFSRLVLDEEDETGLGALKVGPAFINPNVAEVIDEINAAPSRGDPLLPSIIDFYTRHAQLRASAIWE